jgi:hypothetical protein
MKRVILLLLISLSVVNGWCGKRKVLFAIIDGIPADCIMRLQPPTIMEIAHEGHFCVSFAGGIVGTASQTPTISAIGYTNILTGTWMYKHQVKGNDNIHPNYSYPTIFRVAKDQPQPVTTAIYSSWTDNRTILLGEGLEATRQLKIDYVRDGYDKDNVRFPKQPGDVQLQKVDDQICSDAAACISSNAPDLNWLYLWYPDDAFHHNGNGKIADDAIMTVDRQLAKVWASVKDRERKYGEDWLVIITTDHGREEKGFRHGNQSARERASWIATNVKKVNRHFTAGKLSQVDIFPTICQYMQWQLDNNVRFELDGQSFLGKTDMDDFKLFPYDNTIDLQWTPNNRQDNAEVYLTTTNDRFKGMTDNWQKVGEVKVKEGHFLIDFSKYPKSKLYKFAVVTPNTCLTRIFKK